MGEIQFAVSNLTQGYRAAALLKQRGIPCRILPSSDKSGCGYTLAAKGSQEEIALILRRAGIRMTVL